MSCLVGRQCFNMSIKGVKNSSTFCASRPVSSSAATCYDTKTQNVIHQNINTAEKRILFVSTLHGFDKSKRLFKFSTCDTKSDKSIYLQTSFFGTFNQILS